MKIGAQVSSYQDPHDFLSALKDGATFDLIICDLVMKSMNGTHVSAEIRKRNAVVPVLILSGITASDPTENLKQLGVNGYVHKSLGYDVLANAICTLLAGGSHFPDDTLTDRLDLESSGAAPILWDRHMDVLQLVASGATNKEISSTLQISENTVKTYMRQLNCLD